MSTYDPNQPGGYPAGQQPGGYPAQPGGYPGQQPGAYPAGYGAYGARPNPTESNWMGGWSLGLGLASICCGITGLVSIVFGILGIVAANQGRATNRGMSIAGLVISVIVLVGNIVWALSGGYAEMMDQLDSLQ
ncbi:hypothetical protein D4740_01335 [Actinomyces sp. 2119]|uniref:hypothetical protein n=1 Tax=Actinomyces sp. 2119 TaxID=2321393 RepID=UPI000E6BA266|nr:hypothetical protein [Actinomyces sp. 2119]RJF44835.1 hypothetical protein D4740_01335 [Actinomyces sp. 2119]